MLRKAKDLGGYVLRAQDGDLGVTAGFYFEEATWTVRYLAVNAGCLFSGRKHVALSPIGFGAIDDAARAIAVHSTFAAIARSPLFDLTKPLTRKEETAFYRHFGWPVYWDGPERWGRSPYPDPLVIPDSDTDARDKTDHVSLLDAGALTGHTVLARNGELGRIEDVIIDDETWAVRYFVVDTRAAWMGKAVLLSPSWIERVGWEDRVVYVDLLHDIVRSAPEYDPSSVITRSYESELFEYYGRQRDVKAPADEKTR